MDFSMKRLCTICARGGSKGVPGKNIKPIGGKPLIAHSIAQARESGLFDAIAVSSDSEDILALARQYGADVLVRRPAELATDTAAKLPVIRHAVEQVEQERGVRYDILVDLDATSPLRSAADIVAAVALLDEAAAGNVLTAMPARRSPYFNMIELGADGKVALAKQLATPVVRRQDAPQCFDMNASIYVWRRAVLFEAASLFNDGTRLYVMPEERSIDIDSELDLKLVELIRAERGAKEAS
jgi:CMP-N,N'-diacetyllegionaminic acid synthase